jgi:sec-independent protein translocase protein TatA
MMGIGFPELMIILVIIMIIFGAGKLPEIGSAFGNSIKNFKSSMKEADEMKEDMDISKTVEDGDAPKAEIGEGASDENKEATPSAEEPAPSTTEETQAK